MINEYADDTHREQAEEFIMALGRFVLAFERVCDAMRYIIMFTLRSQGLKNQGMEQVLIGDKASAELQGLLGALYCEIPGQDDEDKKHVKALLKSIKEITEKRNILLHSSWNLGSKAAAADEELYAATVRYRLKQNTVSGAEVHGFSASYICELSSELNRIQILLQRLQYCITQNNFKIAKEFAKPM
ncbi:hypothetical protein [Pseudomonas sp.]|uniref:hypothetical protein n=1 Tax=Pseudomonas sp. TaxID=306 RepID=UPI003981D07D